MRKPDNTFTYRNLCALKPRDAAYRVYERGTDKGFNIQILPTGVKSFSLTYYFDEKRKFLSLGLFDEKNKTGLKDARKRVREARALLDDGIDPREQQELDKLERQQKELERIKEASKGSVEMLFDMYAKHLERNGKVSHHETRRALFRDALPYLGKYKNGKDRKAADVTSKEIAFVLSKVCDRGSLVMANRLRSYLSAAFAYGIKYNNDPKNLNAKVQFHLENNPVLVVARQDAEEPRERSLDKDEIHDFWHLLGESELSINSQFALKLILATGGQRVQEILRATWDEFDLQKGEWIIPKRRTKNQKRSHYVPLNKIALKLLKELKTYTGEGKYLFPINKPRPKKPMLETSLTKAVQRLCKREGFKPFSPRDLRRTVKTQFMEMGIPKEHRDIIQNHAVRSDVSDKHYGNVYEYKKEKSVALNKWGSRLQHIVSGNKGTIIEFPSLG